MQPEPIVQPLQAEPQIQQEPLIQQEPQMQPEPIVQPLQAEPLIQQEPQMQPEPVEKLQLELEEPISQKNNNIDQFFKELIENDKSLPSEYKNKNTINNTK
jgi:hypothetical protein